LQNLVNWPSSFRIEQQTSLSRCAADHATLVNTFDDAVLIGSTVSVATRCHRSANRAAACSSHHLFVQLLTGAIAALAFYTLPWWGAVSVIVLAWVGLTMVAGLSFKL
jgi:hypothetical protein